MAIWRCPICAISHQMGFLKSKLFFPQPDVKPDFICLHDANDKKPIWCEMAQIGQRQIANTHVSL